MKTRLGHTGLSLWIWLVSAVLLGAPLMATCGSEPQSADQDQTPDEEKAPSFELPAARGGTMSLSQLLEGRDALALVFYRGFF